MIRYINKIIFTLSLATLFLSAAQAQEPVQTTEHPKFKADEQIDNTESARVASRSNLVADKANRTFESGAIDSMLMEITAEAEEMMFPADELYGEDWNNEHVKAYGDKLVPNNYTIDVSEFAMPANGHVTSRFGWRKRRMHNGIDIKVQTGEPIRAAFDGKIRVKKYQRRGYGYYLVIRHSNGLETVYGHLSKFLVDQDEYVKAGQVIALGGNTGRSSGSHLHFEFRFMGEAINPEHIVDFENKCIKDDVYVFNKATSGASSTAKYASSKSTSKSKSASKSKSSSSTTQKSSANTKYHKIKQGDTLGAIALKHGTTVSKLCKLNKIKPTTTLRIGRNIRVS